MDAVLVYVTAPTFTWRDCGRISVKITDFWQRPEAGASPVQVRSVNSLSPYRILEKK
jgi:hypothetical protein